MSRNSQVVIPYQQSALVKGRMVKTDKYSGVTVKKFYESNVTSTQDIAEWCNRVFRIKSTDIRNNSITLEYDLEGLFAGTMDIEWPLSALNQRYGIRL